MRKLLLSAFLIAVMISGLTFVGTAHFGTAQSGTNVTGIITSNTTWTQANSPYTLTGNVLVNNGVTLTIDVGTTVNLGSYYIEVNGTLQAIGTNAQPITFNGGQITFTQSSTNWIESTGAGCIIQDAIVSSTLSISSSANISDNIMQGTSVNIADSSSSILISGGSPIISDNTISSYYYGVDISAGTPTINGNLISDSDWGIFVSGTSSAITCSPTIFSNILYNDPVGIIINGLSIFSGTATVTLNVITDSQGSQAFNPASGGSAGIVISSGETSSYVCDVTYNTVSGNSYGISVCGAPVTILTNNNIYGNQYYNIYLTFNSNVNATSNWWGTTDPDAISQTIYDYYKDFNLGVVTYSPFLTTPNAEAPTFITASAGTGGSISPSGVISLNYGGSQTFDIAANSGYSIATVLVNGTTIGSVSSYTVKNVNSATTISATFATNPTSTPSPTPTPAPSSTATPTTAPAATSQPTATPTSTTTPNSTPTSTPITQSTPSSTPTIPEFPSAVTLSLVIILAASASVALTLKKRKTGNAGNAEW